MNSIFVNKVKKNTSRLTTSNSRVFVRFLSLSSRSFAQLVVLTLITWQEGTAVAAQFVLVLSILNPLALLLEFGSRTYFIIQKDIYFKDVLLLRLMTIPLIGIGTWIIANLLETRLTLATFFTIVFIRLADSIADIFIAPLDKTKSVNLVSLAHLINGISTGMLSILLTTAGYGFMGILIGSFLGSTLSLVYAASKLRNLDIPRVVRNEILDIRECKRIISSGIRFSFYSFCITLSTSLPTIALERSARYDEVVIFALIANMIGVQNTLLNALRQIQIVSNESNKLQKNIVVSKMQDFLKNRFLLFSIIFLLLGVLITAFVFKFGFINIWSLGVYALTLLVLSTNHFLSQQLTVHLLEGQYSKIAKIGAVTLSLTTILFLICIASSINIIIALITLLTSFLTALIFFYALK